MLVLNIPNPFLKSNYKSFELSCKANLKMQSVEEKEKVKTPLLLSLHDLRVKNCREVQARNVKLSLLAGSFTIYSPSAEEHIKHCIFHAGEVQFNSSLL